MVDAGNALVAGGHILPKPVRLAALLACLNAEASDISLSPGWCLRPHARTLTHTDGRKVTLTAKETELLCALIAADGEECSRAALLAQVWGYGQDISTHTLETHMYRLREKLKEACGDCIETTPGGYRLAI